MVTLACAVLLLGAATWLWPAPGHRRSGPIGAIARPERKRRRRANLATDAEDYAKLVRQLAAMLRAGTSPASAFGLLQTIWVVDSTRTATDIHAGCTRALAQWHTGGPRGGIPRPRTALDTSGLVLCHQRGIGGGARRPP